MNRQWMKPWILSAAMLAGCADTSPEPEAGQPIELTTPEPEMVERADLHVAPHVVELVTPDNRYCTEISLIGAPDLTHAAIGEPVITETIGADGCVDERWTRDWDGSTPLTEEYDWFDPELAQNVYVAPFAYFHEWTYDAAGQLVGQLRESREGDPSHHTWVEQTEYDAQGRITRRAYTGSPLQPMITWTHEESWTFGAHGDEFETHTVASNGEVYSITRQVVRPDGQVAEAYFTNVHAGLPEHLTLRRTFDADGFVTIEETWDTTTGVPHNRTTFERRADGTLQRRVSKNLQLGWLDVKTFDEAERELVYTQDENDDGTIEYRTENRYDAAGNLVFTSTEYDFHRPQTRYSEVVMMFDAQNRMVEQVSTPSWFDGKSRRTRNVYDAIGAGFTSTFDILDTNGQLERTERITRHLDSERVAWERLDHDHDGTLDSLTIRRWAGERPLEVLSDQDDDGSVDSIEQWHYDAAGQLVWHARDFDADTVIDLQTVHRR